MMFETQINKHLTYMKHMLSLAFGICLCWAVEAQNQNSLWTSGSMKSEIEWLTLASDGTLLSGNTQLRDGEPQILQP
jgi:hypothetical protein